MFLLYISRQSLDVSHAGKGSTQTQLTLLVNGLAMVRPGYPLLLAAQAQDADRRVFPSRRAAYIVIGIFVFWTASFVVLSAHANLGKPWTIYLVSYVLFAILIAVVVWEGLTIWRHCCSRQFGQPLYSKNVASTILTAAITMLVVPPLYCHLWYPDRVSTKIVFDQDVVVSCTPLHT